MLVAWRYRQRKSLIQSFDPRAWLIFYMCYIACTLVFWDLRYLAVIFRTGLAGDFYFGDQVA